MKSDNKNGRNIEARLYSLLRLPPLGAEGVDSERVLDRLRDAATSQPTGQRHPRHVDAPIHAWKTPWRVAVICAAVAAALVVALSPNIWKAPNVKAVRAVQPAPQYSNREAARREGEVPGAIGGSSTTKTLADGSRIEMRAGAEAVVENAADGLMIRLNSGSLMVFAAKQAAGRHLYVQTRDLKVSVVGTVFLVRADDKGSRVAVIEGEVRVQQGTVEKSLRPGEQLASNPKSENMQFFLETGWSREAFAYLSKLHESMAKSLASRQSPGRTTSASDKPKFEEASIRLCEQDFQGIPGRGDSTGPGGSGSIRLSPGRVDALCMTVDTLIATAHRALNNNPGSQFSPSCCTLKMNFTYTPWQEDGTRVRGGPDWVRSEKYTVAAVGDSTDAPTLQGPLLLDLLERRFKLKLRVETEEIPVYALTIAKGGLKIKPLESGRYEDARKLFATLRSDVDPRDLNALVALSGALGCSLQLGNDAARWDQLREAVRRGAQPPPCGGDVNFSGPNEVVAIGARPIGEFVDILRRAAKGGALYDTLNGLLVIDKTGLPDTDCLIAAPSAGTLCAPLFNFVMEYVRDESFFAKIEKESGLNLARNLDMSLPKAPTIFAAVEKLGMHLEKSKASREFIVIDHIERPSPN